MQSVAEGTRVICIYKWRAWVGTSWDGQNGFMEKELFWLPEESMSEKA